MTMTGGDWLSNIVWKQAEMFRFYELLKQLLRWSYDDF